MEDFSEIEAPELTELARLAEHRAGIEEALEASLSAGTRNVYAKAIARLTTWAEAEGFTDPLSPATIAAHIIDLSRTRSMSTVAITLAAIRAEAMRLRIPNPVEDPTLQRVVAGVRRQIADRGIAVKRAHALSTPEVARILAVCDPGEVAGRRDAALISLLYAGALRRSEAAALRRSDIRIGRDGMTIRIRRAKGDQFGDGATVGITTGKNPSTDPVAAMARWLSTRKASPEEPIFAPISKSGAIDTTRRA